MILLRHAESEFNEVYSVSGVDPGIEDPRLTERGHRQAREAAALLAEYPLRRVLASPYTRALETAHTLADVLGLPITIEPLVRERGAFVCDIGSPRSELAGDWPHLDFSPIDEHWWSQTEGDDSVAARGQAFRAAARAWPDHDEVLVVTHWGFIRGLTGLSVKNCDVVPFDPHG
jgi:broad specificity phosphatase PhoE